MEIKTVKTTTGYVDGLQLMEEVTYHYRQLFDVQSEKDRNQYNFLLKSKDHEILHEDDSTWPLITIYLKDHTI